MDDASNKPPTTYGERFAAYIGRGIAARRAELKLSPADLAKLTDIDLKDLLAYEAGKEICARYHLFRVECALGVPTGYFTWQFVSRGRGW